MKGKKGDVITVTFVTNVTKRHSERAREKEKRGKKGDFMAGTIKLLRDDGSARKKSPPYTFPMVVFAFRQSVVLFNAKYARISHKKLPMDLAF